MKKVKVKMNEPVYLGLSILEISKTLIKSTYKQNAKLCYINTDSFIINIKTEDFCKDISRLGHMENKGERQSHASSPDSEAIDVWKVARHPPGRRVVACNDYSFWNTIVFFLLQWKAQTIIKLKLKQALKEF